MIRALDSASVALTAQYQRFARSAARVATSDPPPDLVHETAESISVQHTAESNLAVIRTADQMVGSLFDIFA